MPDVRTAIRGFAAGAVAMYFLDPRLGRRRRALMRDGVRSRWSDLTDQLDKAGCDLAHRAQGALATTKSVFRRGRADDSLVVARVRSVIGRAVSHPHAIAACADNGTVVLSGPVLASEADALIHRVRKVPGVREVVSRLERHDDATNIPSLQGGTPRESRSELMQQNWTPALRVGAGALGGALVYYGLRSDGASRLAGLAGAALLARAVANREFCQIVGTGGGPRVVEFDKAIHVAAPPDEVYRFWRNYQNFPRFMTNIKEVRELGGGRSHWVAEGPARIPVSWDAELTADVPNKLLAWRSVPGSRVETEGVVRFDEENGGTRVGIRMFYSPPAGMLGHLVASLCGADPKHEMDEDLVRFKSLIEIGKTRAHGHPVKREELSNVA